MMRDDAGRAVCGEFYRFDHEERTGPRGGRQTWGFAVCVQCGRETERVQTPRPGSLNGVDQALLVALRTNECPHPSVEDAHSKMLSEVARLISCRERPPFRFAIEYLGDRDLDVAICHAWHHAEDGHAMGSFVASVHREYSNRGFLNYASLEADGEARVSIDIGGLTSSFVGPRHAVARALRLAVDPRWVERFARRAVDRLITGPMRADIAAGGAM